MVSGSPPFYFRDREELYEKIKFQNISFPVTFSDNLKTLLSKLMEKSPSKRISNMNVLKDNKWFLNVNWEALYNKQVMPPYIPLVKSDDDFSNFNPVL